MNFDKPIERRGTNCVKWDETEYQDVIPLWVADMDFEAAPAIREALQRRVEHGVFGYSVVPDSYYDAIIRWYERRHHWTVRREWIQYTTGVVPAFSAVIKALTLPGERVLILTPVYNCFFSSIRNSGCEASCSPLRVVEGTLPTYEVDWDDFESRCADEKTTVFLLCNPHNPAGRVWTREELTRMNDICQRHGVRIISDEIHCELVMPGHTFVPFGTINDPEQISLGQTQTATDDQTETSDSPCLSAAKNGLGQTQTATEDQTKISDSPCLSAAKTPTSKLSNAPVICCSPSKSFNTAGLQIANIICADAETRRRIDRIINIREICDVNPFGPVALEAAYNDSEDWIDALNSYLWDNYQALLAFFAEHLPQLKVFNLEGTYLVWVDITATGLSAKALEERLLREAHVWVNGSEMYGAEGFIRINIATQRARLMEGLRRMAQVL